MNNNIINDKGFSWYQIDRLLENQNTSFQPSTVQGVNMLARHLYAAGGFAQQDRMIRDKRKTLDRVVLYSYQGAIVKKYIPDSEVQQREYRALINPNKLKPDYDDKVISVGFESNLRTGDVFEWKGTKTYWLIYLQDLTELAYFKGDIRKCSYIINWKDEDGNVKHTYAAVRGPVETKIESLSKAGTNIDIPNYSLNMMIPKNKDTLAWCKRYAKFLLSDGLNTVCWRIEAVDAYSMENIIQFNAVEYYINPELDDVENKIADAFEPEISTTFALLDGRPTGKEIQGETFIKPKKSYLYTFFKNGKWIIDEKYPIKYTIDNNGDLTIRWDSTYSGQFEIKFEDIRGNIYSKTVVVESLF